MGTRMGETTWAWVLHTGTVTDCTAAVGFVLPLCPNVSPKLNNSAAERCQGWMRAFLYRLSPNLPPALSLAHRRPMICCLYQKKTCVGASIRG